MEGSLVTKLEATVKHREPGWLYRTMPIRGPSGMNGRPVPIRQGKRGREASETRIRP